jgi:hypothetical protein
LIQSTARASAERSDRQPYLPALITLLLDLQYDQQNGQRAMSLLGRLTQALQQRSRECVTKFRL